MGLGVEVLKVMSVDFILCRILLIVMLKMF